MLTHSLQAVIVDDGSPSTDPQQIPVTRREQFTISPSASASIGLVRDVVAQETCPVPGFLRIFEDFSKKLDEKFSQIINNQERILKRLDHLENCAFPKDTTELAGYLNNLESDQSILSFLPTPASKPTANSELPQSSPNQKTVNQQSPFCDVPEPLVPGNTTIDMTQLDLSAATDTSRFPVQPASPITSTTITNIDSEQAEINTKIPNLPVPQMASTPENQTILKKPMNQFTDRRFWQLKPSQLSAPSLWNSDTLTDLVQDLPHGKQTPEQELEEMKLAVIGEATIMSQNKNLSATAMARSLIMKCFPLGDLYGRNTSGKCQSNMESKLPIKSKKIRIS